MVAVDVLDELSSDGESNVCRARGWGVGMGMGWVEAGMGRGRVEAGIGRGWAEAGIVYRGAKVIGGVGGGRGD